MRKLLILTAMLALTAPATGCRLCDWWYRGSHADAGVTAAPMYAAPCCPSPCDPCGAAPAAITTAPAMMHPGPATVVPGPG